MSGERLHIVFCVDDSYARYLPVVVKSIICNNPSHSTVIHVLSDFLSAKSVRLLHEAAGDAANISLEIHIVDDTPLRSLRTSDKWPIQAWYRLLIPEVLGADVRRALYLDTDTLVVGDLGELFAADLEGVSIAAVVEASVFDRANYERIGMEYDERYVCSGLLLMNLDYWREHRLTQKIIEWAALRRTHMVDQDAINYVCRDSKKILPMRYGVVQFFFDSKEFYREPYLSELENCLEHPVIIHYAFCYPWQRDAAPHIMHGEWVKYNRMLRHPVRSKYKGRGWPLIKTALKNILFPADDRAAVAALRDEIAEARLRLNRETHAEPLHIAFCVDEAYVRYICVSIKSLAENNRSRDIVVHLLTDSIGAEGRRLLAEAVEGYDNISINIHIADDTPLRGLRTGNLVIHSWYRVLLPQVLPTDVRRVLYLDADTIVTDRLDELFALDMKDAAVAGSLDPQSLEAEAYERCGYDRRLNYICAGVLLMNLEYCRQHDITRRIIEYAHANNERLIFQDQDAINYVCRDSKIILPFRYGTVQWFFGMDSLCSDPESRRQLLDSLRRPAIIHYIGCHPWLRDNAVRHIMHGEWLKYNAMLKSPVRRIFRMPLCAVVRQQVYKMLHPSKFPTTVTREEAEARLR